MPQDFSKSKRPALQEGMVLPQDDVTVYATKVLASVGYKEGQEIVLHSASAKKLVASGKATEEAPKAKKD